MSRYKIFLAEDNEADSLLVGEALQIHNIECELVVAPDGEKAREVIAAFGESGICPDLIILDLNLPKVDGFALLDQVRRTPNCRHAPVIVLTSSRAPADSVRALDLGANRFLLKPNTYTEYLSLGAIFKEVLGHGLL